VDDAEESVRGRLERGTGDGTASKGCQRCSRSLPPDDRDGKVDPAQTDNAKSFLNDMASTESDAAAKAATKTTIGDLYRVAGDSENAIAAYRDALQIDSKNVNAMAGLGLSLFAEGAGNENRAMMQDGLNYMQAFVEDAPDNHKLKASVIEAIDYLKTAEKLTPKKLPR
ncbi:MAG TPA: tetratricopeptide repeat protein, partial [Pyrinomonadaceae bacterium]|nr:tetratricopeptide repeat protein [Pyrinomonadaceae bacterium]